MYHRLRVGLLVVFCLSIGNLFGLFAQHSTDYYSLSMVGNAGNGIFAPYYLSANKHGLVTHSKSGYLRASVFKGLEMNKRFSYEFGIDLVGLMSSTSPVSYYSDGNLKTHNPGVSSFLIQQAYIGMKYRMIFISAGCRELTG